MQNETRDGWEETCHVMHETGAMWEPTKVPFLHFEAAWGDFDGESWASDECRIPGYYCCRQLFWGQ
jgi:hypothetical protein